MNVNEAAHEIRVLVADDSAVMRTAISRMLQSSPRVRVCGTAKNGVETVERAKQLKPDVVTLDVEMPLLNGMEALKRIMSECPCPVIMVSRMTCEGAEITVEALSAGAFDYIPKEDVQSPADLARLQRDLLEKVEAAALSPQATNVGTLHVLPPILALRDKALVVPKVVVIGTSTGGPKALQNIVPVLPADLAVPVIIVQHMPPGFTGPLARRLNGVSKIKVQEAQQGEQVAPGTVYIAPAGRHTTVCSSTSNIRFTLSDSPNDTLHKPSVDVTMSSVAEVYGRNVLGVILTGMGADGVKGMKLIQEKGGITVGQDASSCAVYGMPRSCAESGVLQRVVPLAHIVDVMLETVRYRGRR